MAFRSTMQYGSEPVFFEQAFQQAQVGDISFHKMIIEPTLNIFQVLQVAGISKLVQVYNFVAGVFCSFASFNLSPSNLNPRLLNSERIASLFSKWS